MPRQEISRQLGSFDRRTLELLLTRLDKVSPPSHLSDLRIVQLMETHGRERRWRYFTFASYREIIANEKLDDQDGPYSSVDFSNVGNFAPFVAEDFYSDVAELNRFTDYAFSRTGKVEDGEDAALKLVKVITPTSANAGTTVRGKKRKREEAGLDVDANADMEIGQIPRKRGRPRKHPVKSQQGGTDATEKGTTPMNDDGHGRQSLREGTEAVQQGGTTTADVRHPPSPGARRKRRRPPDDSVVPEAPPPPRRSRPRKRPPSPSPVDETVVHPPPQDDVLPSHIHLARRPISEPPPPNANAKEAEAQSTSLQYTNHSELSLQAELISSAPPDYHSLAAPDLGTGTMDDRHRNPIPRGITATATTQGTTETVVGPGTGGGTIVQMDKSGEVERANSVSGKEFRVGSFRQRV